MQKNFGLDIVRSIAIILVLAAHLSPFFIVSPIIFNLLYHSGLYGVELFFVLSGFLIGNVFLSKLLPVFSFSQLKNFYYRRLLRILPLYYVILVFLVIIDNLILKSKSLHVYHFIFLQNFFPKEVGFFAVSWTLSIQFWFYLIIPILFLTISNKKNYSGNFIRGFLLAISIIILLRYIYVILFNPTFDFGVRKNILMRFDTFFVGIIFAIIKYKFKLFYEKITSFPSFLFSLFGLSIFYAIYIYFMITGGISYFDRSIFFRVFSWPLISILLMIFVSYFERNKFINEDLKNNKNFFVFFTKLSILSFSLFLVHYEIYTYFETNFKHLNVLLSIFISTSIVFAISYILYNLIENPILLKRNLISNKK